MEALSPSTGEVGFPVEVMPPPKLPSASAQASSGRSHPHRPLSTLIFQLSATEHDGTKTGTKWDDFVARFERTGHSASSWNKDEPVPSYSKPNTSISGMFPSRPWIQTYEPLTYACRRVRLSLVSKRAAHCYPAPHGARRSTAACVVRSSPLAECHRRRRQICRCMEKIKVYVFGLCGTRYWAVGQGEKNHSLK